MGGDDVAFTELVDLDGHRCYAIAYRIPRDVDLQVTPTKEPSAILERLVIPPTL